MEAPQPQPTHELANLRDRLLVEEIAAETSTKRGQSSSSLSCCSSVASPPPSCSSANHKASAVTGDVCRTGDDEPSKADSDPKPPSHGNGNGEDHPDCSLLEPPSECVIALVDSDNATAKPAVPLEEPVVPLQRLERSNSCSQAEGGAVGVVDLEANTEAEQKKLLLLAATTSISHENLAASASASDLLEAQARVQQGAGEKRQLKAQQPSSNNNSNNNNKQQTGGKSSRFFSSKLNTGSLWSLLSAGSTSSMQDLMMQDNEGASRSREEEEDEQKQQSGGGSSSFFGSFTRSQSAASPRRPQLSSSASLQQQDNSSNNNTDDNSANKRRFRFQLKYIGSAVLHKNFTLPMLEWIAKDIKRQTIRGAQSVTSQRQFTIPARDILLEIQANQLMAISCKDGHRIFVHPMHCVSKYAQLQQDCDSFSYLIRDTKDSPTYCHVFQAKSAARVHDVFSAIREVATFEGSSMVSAASLPAPSRLQRSASSELPSSSIIGNSINNNKSQQSPSQQKQSVSQQSETGKTQQGSQFENSYQFEVMFVKKVKLQCRRVPASFVDDALETLRSFEVLKGGADKTKGVSCLAKSRGIISASVDERQEYDEQAQSEQQQQQQQTSQHTHLSAAVEMTNSGDHRRGSSVSLHKHSDGLRSLKEEGSGSRSCQQSPVKEPAQSAESSHQAENSGDMKKHQSVDCLSSLVSDSLKRWPQSDSNNDDLCYANDFSPYNTITSSDLNERIAAIPVVSSSSVSLDHETRQKLARQVRETIMATAANIKKGMYASGDKLDSIAKLTNSKALDSLSCVAHWERGGPLASANDEPANRRASAGHALQQATSTNNNFDLFRRASARQVVKNRTMLLLIGKDELCTISIDKHQMLFSKSFSSIVHCLQGNNNKDHFGLICRDSGKVNPQAENYAGFIFKCQSDKVVREIMGALKQVIYSSQHNYHGYNSPYNPLSSLQGSGAASGSQKSPPGQRQQLSLAYKRGFTSYPIEVDEAARHSSSTSTSGSASAAAFSTASTAPVQLARSQPGSASGQPKNLIKSMFCDDCPLYWYHRLCCDIESLPAEASKSIILRRIDSSLSDKEQDEIYSRFSEFNINSISEHNEIFMSLLRHLCERKQLKHSQQPAHLASMAKNSNKAPPPKYTSSTLPSYQSPNGIAPDTTNQQMDQQASLFSRSHQRSGSSGGSLALMLGQSSQAATEAGSAAMDNLKKAKNTISFSIENILKRRGSSSRDDFFADDNTTNNALTSSRPGSFKGPSSTSRNQNPGGDEMRKSPSAGQQLGAVESTRNQQQWRSDLTNNPLIGLFRRRSSSKVEDNDSQEATRVSSESLVNQQQQNDHQQHSPQLRNHPNSPSAAASTSSELSRFIFPNGQQQAGGSSPSSMLSSGFWKRSIFDKIRQPMADGEQNETTKVPQVNIVVQQEKQQPESTARKNRTGEELRSLWRKAIIEQITLIKMERQNQRLQRAYSGPAEWNPQRVKLNYKDLSYSRDVPGAWQRLLKQDPTKKVEFKEVAQLVRRGCPKLLRGEIWMFLMNQFQLRHGTSFQPVDNDYHGDANQNFRTLLTQLSVTQHEIFNDIGRTFPTHPYYSQYLSIGQLSLFNLLKAYSLLDPEVGYCQGLSFVAGILLLHVNTEDEAFELMRHFLFNFGLRKQYLPSMNALHLQLYQMTRLLKDYENDLFNHFDRYDISPSLYAAPWFLTLFASQFPLGFVARLFDLISLIGIEAIFRVSLKLLSLHRAQILDSCNSLESTMDYIRHNLVKEAMDDDKIVVEMFDQSMSLDLRNKLIEYEIEYTFFRADERAKQKNCSTSTLENHNSLSQAIINQDESDQSSSSVADATATIIIQHILANNTQSSLTPS